jgi:murein DD-endopeptidase MepM/ murein hydrolase activator NlpD
MKAQATLLLLAGFGLTACGTTPVYAVRPGEPRATFEAPKPAYPIREETARAESPASRPMPSVTPVTTPSDDGPTYYKPQPITEAPPPPDAAGPTLRGAQYPGPAMPVRSAPPPALETPSTVIVRPGESLFEVAERVRTPIRAIIELNGIKPPYEVTPGAILRIPPPVIYTVRSGDTLLAISRRFSIDPRSLANLNDIALETPLKPGQRLALPSLVKDSQARETLPTTTLAATPVKPPLGSAPAKLAAKPALIAGAAGVTTPIVQPTPRTEIAKGEPPETPPPAASTVAAAGKGKFIWPTRGDILSAFGPKGTGQRNDGVNIAAKAGDPIKAAAAGEVVYAGNSVPGFGNLVVVKHAGGWTSLYGNLGKMSVKIRSAVEQGQELGVAGTSGSVDRPQVHFELRYAASPQEKARPVDPATLLP